MKAKSLFSFFLTLLVAMGSAWAGTGLSLKEKLYPKRVLLSNEFSRSTFLAPPPGSGGKAFEKQNIVFSAGYGFGNFGTTFLKMLFENGSNVDIGSVGPIHGKAEFGLSDGFGFGVSFNYIQVNASWTGDSAYWYKVTYSNYSILARMNFHFSGDEKFDPYFGIGVGWKQGTWKFDTNEPGWDAESIVGTLNPFGLEITGGFRYYMTDWFGLYLEAGLAKSLLQVGIAVKL